MTPEHAQRLARNEAFFRALNDNIRQAAGVTASAHHRYEFLCECADISCTNRIRLTLAAYEEVRSDARRFVLAPGHAMAEIEQVVEREPSHQVVEKLGIGARLAQALDF